MDGISFVCSYAIVEWLLASAVPRGTKKNKLKKELRRGTFLLKYDKINLSDGFERLKKNNSTGNKGTFG